MASARHDGQYVRVRRAAVGACRLLAISMLVPACGGGSQSLTDYAEGDWTCAFSSDEPPREGATSRSPDFTATVSATSDAEGRVEITFPWLDDKLTGEWRLDDGTLVVRWDGDWGQAEAAPISLDVDQFRSRSGRPEEDPQWITVDVDRRDRAVTFDFDLDESDPGARERISCEKS